MARGVIPRHLCVRLQNLNYKRARVEEVKFFRAGFPDPMTIFCVMNFNLTVDNARVVAIRDVHFFVVLAFVKDANFERQAALGAAISLLDA